MFGLAMKKVTTKKAYTLQEFYDEIKDHEFTAGKPMMVKNGLADVIVFPPLDKNNQVWITQAGFKAPYTKWQVFKQSPAGLKNQLGKMALDDLTGGLTGMSGIFGKEAKKIEVLVKEVAEELEQMGL